MAGHGEELLPRLLADAELEIAHHERERMRARGGADAVDRVLVFLRVGHKRRVHGLLERLEPEGDGDDVRAEHLHARDVRGLLGDVDLAHIDIALHAEVGRGRREGDAVLASAGFGDELFLAHELREQALAHAVVELVRAGVVQILALEIDLEAAEVVREVLAVIHRGRAALKIAPDAPQLGDELRRLRDRVIRLGVFVERLDELRILQKVSAEAAEPAVRRRMLLEVIVKVSVRIHGQDPFQYEKCGMSYFSILRAGVQSPAAAETIVLQKNIKKVKYYDILCCLLTRFLIKSFC